MQVPIFTIISGLNGYKSLSNEVVPLNSYLATGLHMTLSGIAGHYTGRAIREIIKPQSISLSAHPSSPHNDA